MNEHLVHFKIFLLNFVGAAIPFALHVCLYGFGQEVVRAIGLGIIVATGIYVMNGINESRDRSKKGEPEKGLPDKASDKIIMNILTFLPIAFCICLCIAIWLSATSLKSAFVPLCIMFAGMGRGLFVFNQARKRG